jgi:Na+-driven multidrug efflux pump
MIPYSISQATTTIAGQCVGAGDFDQARRIVNLGIFLDCLGGLINGIALSTVLRPVIKSRYFYSS